MNKNIIILSPEDDIHSISIKNRINQLYGNKISCYIFDTRTYPIASEISWITNSKAFTPIFKISSGLSAKSSLDSGKVLEMFDTKSRKHIEITPETVFWFRRYRKPLPFAEVKIKDFQDYCRSTLNDVLLAAVNFGKCINSSFSEDYAELKPIQLLNAKKLGFKIPQTLISTNIDEIRIFIELLEAQGKEIVYKDLGHSSIGYATRKISSKSLKIFSNFHLAPSIFQERINGGVDLRIAVIDNLIFTCEWREESINLNNTDIRELEGAKMWPSICPPSIASKLISLTKTLKLDYGIYDFKLNEQGEVFFLEVNPSGQWLNMEIDGKQQISEALARYLAGDEITHLIFPTYNEDELEKIGYKSPTEAEDLDWTKLF